MTIEDLRMRLQAELPALLKQDADFRQWLEQLIRETAVTSESFDARFDRMLQEFAADRAEQRQRWDEYDREWREWVAKFDAHAEEQRRKWDEQNRKWDEQNRKNNELLEEIKLSRSRQDQGIGALSARSGIASEHSFRAALKGILEKGFDVEVLNINEFDDEGLVFGVPDQVEIDIIIKNGTVILCELKSSMSKSDMYTFERKVRYYEQRHRRPVQRKIAVSPMVSQTTCAIADKLGIEVFSYAEDVTGA